MTSTMNIGRHAQYPLTDLNRFHKNARRGDVEAIMGSIVANGVYRPIYVNKGTYTGRPLEVLAGNHTLEAMRRLAEQNPEDPRWQTVDVWEVDVDDQRAAKIVLADNRTAELGDYNDETLLDILQDLPDLTGTGYSDSDLADLITSMEEEELAPEEHRPDPYEDFITIRMQLPPHLAQQWLALSNGFDSPEEALEYLLDNRVSEH